MNSIRKKLFLGFSIILVLLIILGVVGLAQIKSINNNMSSMYNDQVKGVYHIKEAQYFIAKVQRAEKNVLLATTLEEKKEHSKHFETMYSEGILKNLNKFKEEAEDSHSGEIEELVDKINKLKKIQGEVIKNSFDKNDEKALELSKQSMLLSDEIERLTGDLSDHKYEEVFTSYEESIRIYNSAVILVIISIIAAIFFIVILSVSISSSIVKPLNKGVQLAKSISEGNLKDKILVKSRDEIGVLIKALNNTGEKLKEIVSNIKISSADMEESNKELSYTTEESSKFMNEIGYKISEISNSIQEVVEYVEDVEENVHSISKSASDISNYTNEINSDFQILSESAIKGKESVDQIVNVIVEVEIATKEVKGSINELSELSSKINDITDIIKGISDQTNMLALNAAIEASRAGEQGKGFTVVAEQVKNLAQESAESAIAIEDMIIEVQNKAEIAVKSIGLAENKVRESTSIAKKTDVNISGMMKGIELLSKKIEEISKHTVKQSESTEIVATTIKNVVINAENVSKSTQSINENVNEQIAVIEEISATSSNLYSMTEKLNKLIEYFKI
ncbi:HAMP domain-containing methyl-accepting chemotaxis protein [Oceanirhabdus sp. W0125-5]|uniref:HAMP domain-containing methyl-accepting chemotaxis protein n=1 Tax=Oceanirhabdus sp. W0125-5 TaxID=2999116 RepID=UPI0022F2BFC1|nr:methyl-accepting chemotaxis protein [Oceanirhabdus sp. W0125-5]WBW95025.1 methyl-accepting chemotaxis protein [Oceanirhabdus sp. W0125-5]